MLSTIFFKPPLNGLEADSQRYRENGQPGFVCIQSSRKRHADIGYEDIKIRRKRHGSEHLDAYVASVFHYGEGARGRIGFYKVTRNQPEYKPWRAFNL